MPFIFISVICAIFLIKGFGYTGALIHFKETIWTVMTLNYFYMYIKRTQAQKFFNSGDLAKAKETVKLLPNILLPINIALGLIAIFSGVLLRGF